MRIGIVGTNFVSDMFMFGIKHVADAEVVAVCSGHLENAVAFSSKYQIEKVYDTYQQMADDQQIDAVYLGTPNSMHHDQAIYFLNKKIAVYCEKPMATNVREVREMIAAAKKNKTLLVEGLLPFFAPGLENLKDNLDKLGQIHSVTFNFSKYSSRYDAYLEGKNPTTFRNELSNGSAMDLGVYCLATCYALFGVPESIYAAASLLETGVDGNFAALLKYEDFVATLTSSKCSDTKISSEICGEKGTMVIDSISRISKVVFYPRKGEEEIIFDNDLTTFVFSTEQFVEDYKKGKKECSVYSYDQCIQLHTILTQIREKAGILYKADISVE